MSTITSDADRKIELERVIKEGMEAYPLEDGWLILNEARMQNVCATCQANASAKTASFTPTIVPEGAGSLAEAIVAGDTKAAFELLGNRPMFALADAAADFDAVLHKRAGKHARISALLAESSSKLTNEQLQAMATALTSALDGTYNTETEAVKMAVLKAIAVVTK